MQDLGIRQGVPDDFGALDGIRAAAFAPVFASLRSLVGEPIAAVAFRDAEREQQDLLRDLLTPGEGRVMMVAERDGAACGFCALTSRSETGSGEIGLNAVHPSAQGRGIGQRLHTAALDRMRAKGMRFVSVGMGGDGSHAPARAAYGKLSFAAAATSLHLYRKL